MTSSHSIRNEMCFIRGAVDIPHSRHFRYGDAVSDDQKSAWRCATLRPDAFVAPAFDGVFIAWKSRRSPARHGGAQLVAEEPNSSRRSPALQSKMGVWPWASMALGEYGLGQGGERARTEKRERGIDAEEERGARGGRRVTRWRRSRKVAVVVDAAAKAAARSRNTQRESAQDGHCLTDGRWQCAAAAGSNGWRLAAAMQAILAGGTGDSSHGAWRSGGWRWLSAATAADGGSAAANASGKNTTVRRSSSGRWDARLRRRR
ncbi:hypothetical protein Scep_019037 [Stephania cephalantha]|uniref:Uncharacterized protein n=1 Tax=Stephania cephalantha TaxID=152367 RepID=A0AAP0NLS2_9MAGN